MKKVVLLTIGQPSTNPRLVKEADKLQASSFDVYVIYAYRTRWAWESDKLLLSISKWTPLLVGGSPYENKTLFFFTRLRAKIFGYIAKNITLKFGIAEIAIGRTYPNLLRKAKSIKADLYIAHTLAALPAAIYAAKKNNAKSGFDAEDFHRQEIDDDPTSFHYRISKYIEDKYLTIVDYVTTSSPIISQNYASLYNRNVTCILNVFPKKTLLKKSISDINGPIKLFWFSQNISPNRGLEDIIGALKLVEKGYFELHLLGFRSQQIDIAFINNEELAIYYHEPIPSDQIHDFAAKFDIGLALEPSFSKNNDYALSNKIFTYMQAGLAIIASDTMAQKALINKHPLIGKLYEKRNTAMLSEIILDYYHNKEALNTTKKCSYEIAQTELNWENESEKFLAIIKSVLST